MRGKKHGSRQQLQSKGRMHGGSTQVTHTSHTSLMAERELETFGSGRGRRRGEKHGSHAPPSVRPPSKAAPAPCHLPARPFLWLYFRSFIPILFQAAHRSLFYCKFLYPHGHIRCATFCHGKWGQQETLDSEGFAPEGKVVFPSCRRDFAGLYQEQEDATVF